MFSVNFQENTRLVLFCEVVVGDRIRKSKQDKKDAAETNDSLPTTNKALDEKRRKVETTFSDLQLWNISKVVVS